MSAHSLALSAVPGGLRRASQLADVPDAVGFPISQDLAPLLPWPGLRPGATISMTAGSAAGLTSLLLSLLAGPSASGAWCALLGASEVSASAAAQAGVSLSRLALVPDAGAQWEKVAGALLEGIDLVAVNLTTGISPRNAARLAAKARNRGSVLLPFGSAAGSWPRTDAALSVTGARWHGLSAGRGLLRYCELSVAAFFHGRHRHATLWPYGKPAGFGAGQDLDSMAPVISLADRRNRHKGAISGARTGRTVS